MSIHEEDVLGKAYDARLMRRLLTYLRPYKTQVVHRARGDHRPLRPPAGAAVPHQDCHRRLHSRRRPVRARLDCAALPAHARGVVRARVHADVDAADDGSADHVRHAHAGVPAPPAPRPAVLRSQPGRPPHDPRHDRCGRAQRAVHGWRGLGVRRRVHARRHHGGAACGWTGGWRWSPSRCCRSSC